MIQNDRDQYKLIKKLRDYTKFNAGTVNMYNI